VLQLLINVVSDKSVIVPDISSEYLDTGAGNDIYRNESLRTFDRFLITMYDFSGNGIYEIKLRYA